MKLIDADNLTLCYAGLAKMSPYDFVGITKLFYDQVQASPVVEAIPVEWIKNQIKDHPGKHAASGSRLLSLWEEGDKHEK